MLPRSRLDLGLAKSRLDSGLAGASFWQADMLSAIPSAPQPSISLKNVAQSHGPQMGWKSPCTTTRQKFGEVLLWTLPRVSLSLAQGSFRSSGLPQRPELPHERDLRRKAASSYRSDADCKVAGWHQNHELLTLPVPRVSAGRQRAVHRRGVRPHDCQGPGCKRGVARPFGAASCLQQQTAYTSMPYQYS